MSLTIGRTCSTLAFLMGAHLLPAHTQRSADSAAEAKVRSGSSTRKQQAGPIFEYLGGCLHASICERCSLITASASVSCACSSARSAAVGQRTVNGCSPAPPSSLWSEANDGVSLLSKAERASPSCVLVQASRYARFRAGPEAPWLLRFPWGQRPGMHGAAQKRVALRKIRSNHGRALLRSTFRVSSGALRDLHASGGSLPASCRHNTCTWIPLSSLSFAESIP
mmetsp:Transcript_126294/g.229268  ORF Transcript_126294/g.229268 Transcript_126294/m.229268 type:complete len:224 (+) Transcript_126294:782-1453(+)